MFITLYFNCKLDEIKIVPIDKIINEYGTQRVAVYLDELTTEVNYCFDTDLKSIGECQFVQNELGQNKYLLRMGI
jgi:hypothetical protein